MQNKEYPKISLIIPSRNEEKVIERKIKNTLELDYPKDKLEIILVDDYSTDNTKKIMDDYATKYKVIKSISNKSHRGKVYSMNTAFKIIQGIFIAITDTDVILEKNILKNALNYFKNPKIGAVCGIDRIVQKPQNKLAPLEERYMSVLRKTFIIMSNIDSTPHFNGSFMFLKKDILPKFDPHVQSEDLDVAIKIRKKGYRAICAEDCIYHEEVSSEIKKYNRQKIRRATGLIYIFWKHKDVLFNLKYGLFGLIIFPFEFLFYFVQPLLVALTLLGLLIFIIVTNPLFLFIYFPILILFMQIKSFKWYLLLNGCLLLGMYKNIVSKSTGFWENVR